MPEAQELCVQNVSRQCIRIIPRCLIWLGLACVGSGESRGAAARVSVDRIRVDIFNFTIDTAKEQLAQTHEPLNDDAIVREFVSIQFARSL